MVFRDDLGYARDTTGKIVKVTEVISGSGLASVTAKPVTEAEAQSLPIGAALPTVETTPSAGSTGAAIVSSVTAPTGAQVDLTPKYIGRTTVAVLTDQKPSCVPYSSRGGKPNVIKVDSAGATNVNNAQEIKTMDIIGKFRAMPTYMKIAIVAGLGVAVLIIVKKLRR